MLPALRQVAIFARELEQDMLRGTGGTILMIDAVNDAVYVARVCMRYRAVAAACGKRWDMEATCVQNGPTDVVAPSAVLSVRWHERDHVPKRLHNDNRVRQQGADRRCGQRQQQPVLA